MHPSIKRARATLDRLKGVKYEYACENARRDQYEVEAAAADALIARQRVKKSFDGPLVYKTFETPRPQPQPQQGANVMDEKTSAAWNTWMTDYVKKYVDVTLEEYTKGAVEGIGEAFSIERGDMRKHIAKELAQLRAEIASLREELASLRSDMSLGIKAASGKIAGLHRNVA